MCLYLVSLVYELLHIRNTTNANLEVCDYKASSGGNLLAIMCERSQVRITEGLSGPLILPTLCKCSMNH